MRFTGRTCVDAVRKRHVHSLHVFDDAREAVASYSNRYVPRLRPAPIHGLVRGLVGLFPGHLRAAGEETFESAIARAAGVAHAVCFASARAAIATALRGAGIAPGDVVIVPSYTAPCVPALIHALGARVRIADVSLDTLVVTPSSLAAVSDGARAVLPTHTEGTTVDVAGAIARLNGMFVLEDAAHALGASHAGAPVGSRSSGCVVSFGQGKHLNTLFGGVFLTDRSDLAAAMRTARRTYPAATARRAWRQAAVQCAARLATSSGAYPFSLHAVVRGFNAAGIDLPTLLFEDTAPIADVSHLLRRWPGGFGGLAARQLDGFVARRERRREIARTLREHLNRRGLRHQRGADPGDHPLAVTVFHARRNEVRRGLLALGVDTQPTWMRSVRDDAGRVDPIAERAARDGFYLPLHDEMRDASVAHVLDALDRVVARVGSE